MHKKILNLIFIVCVFCFLVIGLARTVLFPKDMNYYENRYANQIEIPTMESINNQVFQNSIEDALADQIPKAQVAKKVYNELTAEYLGVLLFPMLEDVPDMYASYKGMLIYGGNQLVYSPTDLQSVTEKLEQRVENYNETFETCPDVQFYVYYIEKDTDINFETGEKVGASSYLLEALELPQENKDYFNVDSYEQFREDFYLTDHHWNFRGSYRAYLDVLEMLGVEETPLVPVEEVLIEDGFSGSKSSSIGTTMFHEEFWAYRFRYPFMRIEINGDDAEADYGNQDAYLEHSAADVSYGKFYGWDYGEVVFDTGKAEKDNILIIGESYDNALLKLLASHYNITRSIDLRYYEHYMGENFEFSSYIKEHDINKVLLIGNIDYFTKQEFELKG